MTYIWPADPSSFGSILHVLANENVSLQQVLHFLSSHVCDEEVMNQHS